MALTTTTIGPLEIAKLEPTQDGLRDLKKFHRTAWALERGKNSQTQREILGAPLAISRFEDGKLFVHNGHHRIAALIVAKMTHLAADAYTITNWTYADYLEINWTCRYLTPFDPRTESRVADLATFRRAVENLFLFGASLPTIETFIRTQTQLYKCPRRLRSFTELAALEFHPNIWNAVLAERSY
jgi:hypothetical protein